MNESMNTSKILLCLPNMVCVCVGGGGGGGGWFFLISLHWVIINLFYVFCTQRNIRYCQFKAEANKTKYWYKRRKLYFSEIERKAIIRNRYNYPTPSIRDIKGKETQTRNNWTLMETSLAESQTDSYFPTKWPNGYLKQNDVSETHIHTVYNKNKPWQKSRLGTVSEKYFTGGA